MNKLFFFILFLIIDSSNVYSSDFMSDVKDDLISPFNTEAIRVLEVGSGITLVAFILKNKFNQKLENDISEDRPIGKYSKLGDILGHSVPNAAYVLLMGGSYIFTNNQVALDRSALMIKATLYSGAMTEITKKIVFEKRPNGGSYSFPSGHATTAFAFSSIVTMEHSLPWAIAANSMAAFVGFSRVNDKAHYIHDVIAGATIGSMYGVGVYYAQKKREENMLPHSTFFILPLKDGIAGKLSFLF